VVAGVATAGIPHGAILADRLEKPFVYVRASAKEHGRRNLIEGELPPEARALVVEDLISTGGSCMKAVTALRESGSAIAGVLAIFQYGFPEADALFSENGVVFRTLSDYDTLIEEAVAMGYISEMDLSILRQWRQNPQQWGALYA
jgi:orotate phosphoribosyltransferase